jgi:hypothetical protein
MPLRREAAMKEEVFNLELRKFLKQFGVTAQREVEKAVDQALRSAKLRGSETLRARAVLTIDGLGSVAQIEGTITLG